MKTKKTLFGILAIAVAAVVQVQAQSFLTNGLVAYYPFNGNANDASGNGHNGTINGATLTTDRFGYTNHAYLFGGTSYISVPMGSALFSTNFTASVWFNAYDINNSWPTLLEEVGNTAFVLGLVGQTSGAFPENIGDLFAFATDTQANQGWALNPLPLFQPSLNEYYHVVVVRAGTNVRMYVNAQLLADNQIVSPTVEPGNTFYIGCSGDNLSSDWVFHGVLDDVRIYNRALSPSEVQQLYQYESFPEPATAPTNGLAAYYPFNGNAKDASGNRNDGTPLNTVSASDRFGNVNSALAFNGINGSTSASMVMVSNSLINLGQFGYTISMWMMPSNLTQIARSLFGNANTSVGLELGFNNDNEPGTIDFFVGPGNAFWDSLNNHSPVMDFQAGQWYSVSLTKNELTYSLYINGQLEGQVDVPEAAGYNYAIQPLIGAYGLDGSQAFSGNIDDVRIYNRALSPEEVTQLYVSEAFSQPTPPSIITQPQSILVNAHDTTTLSVTTAGSAPLVYQWFQNGKVLTSANASGLVITNVRPFNVGNYFVIVTNSYGAATSSVAGLTMNQNYANVQVPYLNVSMTVSNSLQNISKYTNGITTTANPSVSRLVSSNILALLAFDEYAEGNWPSNSFPKSSTLALASGRFVVVNGTNFLLDTSDIMTFTNYLPQIYYGKLNNTNGLASPSLTTVQMAALAFDDTFVSGGKNYQFYLAGILTQTRTNSLPVNKKYTEMILKSLGSGTGAGSILGVPFMCNGTFSATATSAKQLNP